MDSQDCGCAQTAAAHSVSPARMAQHIFEHSFELPVLWHFIYNLLWLPKGTSQPELQSRGHPGMPPAKHELSQDSFSWQPPGEGGPAFCPCTIPALCLGPCNQQCCPAPQPKNLRSYCSRYPGRQIIQTSPEPRSVGPFPSSWWEEMRLSLLKQQLITSYLGICPDSLCKKRRLLCFYSWCLALCFSFTSVSCSDTDVFLRKSSCASGFLFSFMTLRENICCCCCLAIFLQLSS